MHVSVFHKTVYAFDAPSTYSMQALRLWPRPTASQTLLAWSMVGNDRRELPWVVDAYGNIVHTLAVMGAHESVTVTVQGEVLTTDTTGVLRDAQEPMPSSIFLRQTPLTTPDDAIRDLVSDVEAEVRSDRIAGLHSLMAKVRDSIEYVIGSTDVGTPAAEALNCGKGVCQDHAHVFVSCARELGVPARYISGYLAPEGAGDGPHEASHAWAEALVDGLGWIGFDIANRTCPTELYVRGAAGLDYRGAAPVLGVRRGGGAETLEVEVRVSAEPALHQTLDVARQMQSQSQSQDPPVGDTGSPNGSAGGASE